MSNKDIIVKDYDGNYLYPRAYKDYEGNVIHSTYVKGVKGNAETTYRTGNVNLTPANVGAVDKTGDTMTGDLTVSSSAAEVTIKDTSHNGTMFVGWGSGHKNHGVYSNGYAPTTTTWTSDPKWLVYRDESGNVTLNGNATSATTATNANNIKNKAGNYVTLQNALLDMIYPVGSIYITVNGGDNYNPKNFLGGTWVRITDTFLYCGTDSATDTYRPGQSGGEKTHTLTTTEIPAHTHGNKSLTGSLRAYAWDSGTSSGIVSKATETINVGHYSGSQVGHIIYSIDASHEHTSVGGGGAHNNLPPWLAVYVWKWTA